MKLHERLAAVKSARLDVASKCLLFAFASYAADDEARPVWPSVLTLADDTGMNKDTVTTRLRALAALGVVECVKRHGCGHSARYRVDWHAVASVDAKPDRSGKIRSLRMSDSDQDPTGPDHEIRQDRIMRSDGVGVKDPTGSDRTIHRTDQETDQETDHRARAPAPERAGQADVLTGSKPEQSTAASDSQRATTPTPSSAAPLPQTAPPLTLPLPPATLSTSAPAASAPSGVFGASTSAAGAASPTAKKKPKQPPPLDLEAWGKCCQAYDAISGRTRAWDPERGDGRLIAETMAEQGASKIVARFEQASRDRWCLDKRPAVSALCRARNDVVDRLDADAEQAALDASRPVSAPAARAESTPAQPAPDAWDDMWSRAMRYPGGFRQAYLDAVREGRLTLADTEAEQARRRAAVKAIGAARIQEMSEREMPFVAREWRAALGRVA